MDHILFTQSADRHLICGHVLDVVNNVAMYLGVHIFLRIIAFLLFRYIQGY